MASATLLLAARSRFNGQPLPTLLAKSLARADLQQGSEGERAQLRRHFQLIPDHWPTAALTRQLDAGDALQSRWLRVDPAFVVPDMSAARMMSHGDALGLTHEDVQQLLPALKPLFGDAGFALEAPHPARWYLRLPTESRLPEFSPPEDVLGDDLFTHLPQGELGRRWRALISEAQVVLHNHPWNAVRTAQGKPTVNSLWFWGAGVLPDFVRTPFRQVRSRDPLLQALAGAAGIASGNEGEMQEVDALVDLRHLRMLEALVADAIAPLLAAVNKGELQSLVLDFEDGAVFTLRQNQRWRFWRRPWSKLEA